MKIFNKKLNDSITLVSIDIDNNELVLSVDGMEQTLHATTLKCVSKGIMCFSEYLKSVRFTITVRAIGAGKNAVTLIYATTSAIDQIAVTPSLMKIRRYILLMTL